MLHDAGHLKRISVCTEFFCTIGFVSYPMGGKILRSISLPFDSEHTRDFRSYSVASPNLWTIHIANLLPFWVALTKKLTLKKQQPFKAKELWSKFLRISLTTFRIVLAIFPSQFTFRVEVCYILDILEKHHIIMWPIFS